MVESKSHKGRMVYMSLNIKNEEAVRLARRLAAATGESVTQAVVVAVRERLQRVEDKDHDEAAERAARLREIANDAASRWIEPYRSSDHGDLLYDNLGLPK